MKSELRHQHQEFASKIFGKLTSLLLGFLLVLGSLVFVPQAFAWTGTIASGLTGVSISSCSILSISCTNSSTNNYNATGYSSVYLNFSWSSSGCIGGYDSVSITNNGTKIWGVSGCSGYPASGNYSVSLGNSPSGTLVLSVGIGPLHSAVSISNVTISGTDNAPTISSIAAQAVNENSAISGIAFTISDDVTAATSLSVSASSSNTTLVPVANITVGGTGTSRTLSITPASNQSGTSTITVSVTDAQSQTASASFVLTVNFVNAAPSFTKGANQTVNENVAAQSITAWATSISAGKSDETSQTITFSVTNNNNALFSAQPSVSSSGTLTFTPASCAFGSATVSIYATDNGGTTNGGSSTSATQTFVITVNQVDYPPTLAAISNVTIPWYQGATVALSGIAKGTCGGTIVVTASSGTTTVLKTPVVTYTSPDATGILTLSPVQPPPTQNGSSLVTVTVSDGVNNPVSKTFTTNVLWVSRIFR